MFSAQQYIKATSIQQALELNQKRTSAILGGGCWMRLGKKNYSTLIDLSGLGLDQIEENDDEISLGAMVTLRQMETSQLLNRYFGDFFVQMVRHIVGVQFRNCATVGGSIVSRFGFSDILTGLLVLDCDVVLAQKGRVSLNEYAQMPHDRDVLTHIIIKKNGRCAAYESVRNTETDLPILTCAVSILENSTRFIIGARPQRAVVYETSADPEAMIQKIQEETKFGSNMRASKEYRRMLSGVLCHRALEKAKEGIKCR